MDGRNKCFLNNVKRVLFLDPYIFCIPPLLEKSSVIFNQECKNASMEMAVLFSMQWNIFLKSEVTRSIEQRNPRWH